MLPARSNHEVRIGQSGGVQGARDRGLVDLVRRDATRGQPPERIDELGSAGVVERDVQLQLIAAGGRGERLCDGAAGFGR